jgi:hypothetical protein
MKWPKQEIVEDIIWSIKNPLRTVQFFLMDYLRIPYRFVFPVTHYRNQKLIREFPPGTVVENCSYHPCIILKNEDGDITALDLLTNTETCCSLFHCGVAKLTGYEVQKIVATYRSSGERGLMALRGWPESEIENFMTTWRNEPTKLQRELSLVTDPNF